MLVPRRDIGAFLTDWVCKKKKEEKKFSKKIAILKMKAHLKKKKKILPKYVGTRGVWSSTTREASAKTSNKHPTGSRGCPTQPSSHPVSVLYM